MTDILPLITLFASAFLAATLFPAQSEIILTSLNLSNNYQPFLLLTIASLGNILGACLNYFIGYFLGQNSAKKENFSTKNTRFWQKMFYLRDKMLNSKSWHKAQKIFNKWGKISLLLAWMPIIGDPITLIAGIFRVNFYLFLLLVSIGKIARYLFLIQIF